MFNVILGYASYVMAALIFIIDLTFLHPIHFILTMIADKLTKDGDTLTGLNICGRAYGK